MIALLSSLLFLMPADSLTLETAHRLAAENFPRRAEVEIAESIRDRRIESLNARFLLGFSLSAQGTYTSHVPDIGLDLPGISLPDVPHDQYRVAADVEQLIYDGGATSIQRRLEDIDALARIHEVEVAMLAIRQQVDAFFFGAIEAQRMLASLEIAEQNLATRIREVESRIDAGVALPSHRRQLTVERLGVRQQQADVSARRRAALDALAELTGRPIGDDITLVLPAGGSALPSLAEVRRPETEVFELNRRRLDESADLISRRVRPTVAAFAEGAYGRPPGNDFFDDRFRPFFSGGVRVQWKPWQWNVTEREQEVTALERQGIDAGERAFLQRLEVEATQLLREIERLDATLQLDDEIILEREAIVREAAARLREGAITPAEYLVHHHSLLRGRLQRDRHLVQRASARARYLTTLGHDHAY